MKSLIINNDIMNLEKFIHNDESLDKNIRTGSLLLASPLMHEPYFSRSVIALIDTDPAKGCLGLTLNKLTTITMGHIMPGWERFENVPVFSGGPVDHQRLFMLHRLGDVIRGSVKIADGLYLGNNFGDAFRYLEMGGQLGGELRFFLGYSGWTSGQLESEILNQSWAVNDNPDTTLLLKGSEEEYWQCQVKELGENYRPWLLLPVDPNEN